MIVALVQNSIVESVADLSEEQVQSAATRYQAVIDLAGLSPQPKASWRWNGSKFLAPASYDTVTYIQETIYLPAKAFGRALLNRFVSENIAIGTLQSVVGSKVDGVFGPQTKAILDQSDASAIFKLFSKRRPLRYQENKSWDVFGKGWVYRLLDVVLK